jgi:hypothetical protein
MLIKEIDFLAQITPKALDLLLSCFDFQGYLLIKIKNAKLIHALNILEIAHEYSIEK